MKKFLLALFVIPVLALVACGGSTTTYQIQEVTNISPAQVKTMLDDDDSIILVDVREQYEYDDAHIEGAILVPLSSLSDDAKELIPDKNAKYIIYCRSGNRSAQAADYLVQEGYQNIYNMEGGIISWPYGTVS